MKKWIMSMMIVIGCQSIHSQNKLLSPDYWKTKPNISAVKQEIQNGNSATEFNNNQFDAASQAILNDADTETILYLISLPGNGVNKETHDGRIYLHWAASKNRPEIIEYLMKNGSDVNHADTGGRTPIFFGAMGGMKKEAYEVFFNNGSSPLQKDKNEANLLMNSIARDNEQLETLNYLLSKGISPNDKDAEGRSFVDYAARSGNVALVKKLIEKKYPYTEQILLMAAMGGRAVNTSPIFQYLIEEVKIPVNSLSKDEKNALHYLSGKENSQEQVAYLVAKGTSVIQKDKEGNTPLHFAVRNKQTDNTRLFLTKSAPVNAANSEGQTPLFFAAQYGTPEAMEILISKGADALAKDKAGNNIAYYIVESFQPRRKESLGWIHEKVELLKKAGVDFNTIQSKGQSLYHLIAEKDHKELLEALPLSAKIINKKNDDGLTAIQLNAMVAKDTGMLKKLLELGADKSIVSDMGETAYDLAKENELLQKNNADLEFLK